MVTVKSDAMRPAVGVVTPAAQSLSHGQIATINLMGDIESQWYSNSENIIIMIDR